VHRPSRILLLPFLGLLLALTACSGDGEDASEACGHTDADPEASLAALQQRIEDLGGDDARPVVPVDLFLEGNHDVGSIAPNLDPHPGMDTFRCVLGRIAARPDVAHVVAGIDEVTFEDEWPYADRVYVITTATAREVHDWATELQPDPYDESVPDDWLDGEPPGAPAVPARHRIVVLYWD
jgi:hypothetical protein